jgi:tetratricopeptide (TPR) repeat protein
MFCSNCGTKIEEGVKFCTKCGKATNNAPEAQVTVQQQIVQQPAQSSEKKPKRKIKPISLALLLIGFVAIIICFIIGGALGTTGQLYDKTAPSKAKFYSVNLNSSVKVGTPVNFSAGNVLPDELQWLAVHIACIGIYNMAQAGDYTLGDPFDYYQPRDIRDFLTERSGTETKTDMFYGICFNYAQAAYDEIAKNKNLYAGYGVKEWYIAGAFENANEIVLFVPTPQGQHDMIVNGVYVKAVSQHKVRTHGGATMHAWFWVYGNDNEIYWIDPTWTDNTGYPWWGVVRNGEELQLNPLENLCKEKIETSDEAFAWNNSGNANKNNSDYEQAAKDYTEAVSIDPNNAIAYYNRGVANANKGNRDAAIADYTEAIRLDPNLTVAYIGRGLIVSNAIGMSKDEINARWDAAIADYKTAIRLDPYNTRAYAELSGMLASRHGNDFALEYFNEAIRLNPNNAAIYVARGWIYRYKDLGTRKKSLRDAAIADFTEAIRIDPSNIIAYMERAKVYWDNGYFSSDNSFFDKSIADCTTIIKLDPINVAAYLQRASSYKWKGDRNRGIADVETVLQIDPNNSDAKLTLESFKR